MENLNSTFFPKTKRLKEEIITIGPKEVKGIYQVTDLVKYLNLTFQKEYDCYLQNEEYFPGCPFKVYMENYQQRLKDYQIIYPDADEFDFLDEEDLIIERLLQLDNDNKQNFYSFYPHLKPDPHRRNLNLSIDKTRKFIDNRFEELGHYFYAPGFKDPDDIPENLPREYWKPARNWEAQTTTTRKEPGHEKEKPKAAVCELKELHPKLSLKQVALIFFYEKKLITKDTADGIAEEYGWCSKTSGHKLYQDFIHLRNSRNRLGDPGSEKKLKNNLERIEGILNFLSEGALKEASKEISSLQNIYKSVYE